MSLNNNPKKINKKGTHHRNIKRFIDRLSSLEKEEMNQHGSCSMIQKVVLHNNSPRLVVHTYIFLIDRPFLLYGTLRNKRNEIVVPYKCRVPVPGTVRMANFSLLL